MFDDNARLTLADGSTQSLAEIFAADNWAAKTVKGPAGDASVILQFYKEQLQTAVTVQTSTGRKITVGAKSKLMLEGGGYAVAGAAGCTEPRRRSIVTESGPETVTGVLPSPPARDLWRLVTHAPHACCVDGVWFVLDSMDDVVKR